MNIKQLIIILSIASWVNPCMAFNALRGKPFNNDCQTKKPEELNLNHLKPVREFPTITHQDVADIVPTEFMQNDPIRAGLADRASVSHGLVEQQLIDQRMRNEQVVNQIVQNTANKLMKSDIIRNSVLMKTAKQVENSSKVDIAIKEKNEFGAQEEIEHRVKVDMQPLQGSAKIQYSGLIDSKIEYQAMNNTFQVSFEESLSSNSKIALTHLNDNQQSRQLLQYQLSW